MSRLAPLALIVLLAAGCGDKDKSSSPSTTTTASTTTTRARARSRPGRAARPRSPRCPRARRNRLLLGKRDLYPLLAGSLGRYVPNQVTGKSVSVVQSRGHRQLLGREEREAADPRKDQFEGEATAATGPGQQADFVGHLVKAKPKDKDRLGVKEKSGGPVLQNQGVYVLVSVGDLKLH